jgi:hypothetical protein
MIIHLLANADFTIYQYHEVYLPGGATYTVNGASVPVGVGSGITLPIGINTATNNSGAFFLIGKKKPESLNTKKADGSYPIK